MEKPAAIGAIVLLSGLRTYEREPALGKLTHCNAGQNGALALGSRTDVHRRSSHMRALLGLAALAAIMPGAPAQAQSFSISTFGTANADPWVTTLPQPGHDRRSH